MSIMKTASDTIHDLTRAEIARQTSALAAEDVQITSQRAEMYTRSSKDGSRPSSLSVDQKAANAYAKFVLGGAAPASLSPPASEFDFESLDRQLAAKQQGIRIALKILGDKDLVARAAEAVAWAEAHATQWRQLAREIIVATARLEALERAAADMLGQCVDIDAINLPMTNLIGQKEMRLAPQFAGYVPIRPDDLIEAGVKAGIVTESEIRRAQKLG